ncbi:hypothetical protein CAPTEDRAFT_73810, partial [Capitella teleta]
CEEVHNYKGKEAQCDFVTETESCENEEGLFEYNDFIYCLLGGDLVPLAAVILVIWWLFCFCGLAVCADDYFCPALVVISKTLRLSPNVAISFFGVTFLAFGNGAPDVFSALAALDSGGDPGLGLGGLLGAGMFVTSVVCGAIAIIRPFRVMQRPFMRDVIFYLCGIYWTFCILWRGKIFFLESIGFLLVWVFYVIVVVVSGSIYKKQKAQEESKKAGADGSESKLRYPVNNSDDSICKNEEPEYEFEDIGPLRSLLEACNPINLEEWPEMRWWARMYEVFKAFGWLGFFVALGWIYVIANEVVAILQALGIVMKISSGILGLTLLAWGNSIGDLIADTVMARQGFARMGFAACFGGPFFSIL